MHLINRYLAALEDKKQAQDVRSKPSTSSSGTGANTNKTKYKGLSEADRKLAERLDRLKEDRKKMRGKMRQLYIYCFSFTETMVSMFVQARLVMGCSGSYLLDLFKLGFKFI